MGNQIIYESTNEAMAKSQDPPLKSLDQAGTLNPPLQELSETYSRELIRLRQGYTPIHVDEIASYLARLYEKIRKVIDWQDDSVLRRGAIERILKRIIFPKLTGFMVEGFNVEKLAETVTIELVRGGHLPNDAIPRERIAIVAEALNKYMYFLEYTSAYKLFEMKQKINLATFVLEIAACEIEEILTHPIKEYGVIGAMTETLDKRISIYPSEALTPQEKRKQIYIATLRTLYDLDDNFITYQLLKQKYPGWHNPNRESTEVIAKELPATWKNIQSEINQPIIRKFNTITERIDTVFMLLDDVLEKIKDNPQAIKATLEDKKKFTQLVSKAYDKRYQTLKKRLLRLAIFSTLSVFLSNWFTFYLIEVPLANLFYEGFNLFTAIVDFLIPTAVMFCLVIIIRPPKKDNLKKVVSATLGFMYQDEKQEHYQIRLKEDKLSIFRIIMLAIQVLTTLLAFTGIALVFYIAKLPITSVVFDTLTIALTVFGAVVIKNKSKELNVDEHTGIQDFLLDIIAVPVAKVGSVFAKKWKEYNIVAIFFNFVIETPFTVILNFVQGWSEYIKERRAELH
jgi:hypothetical protein